MKSEARISQELRMDASRRGWRLFRNNVGACRDEKGRIIRYGLANESKSVNQAIKSGDLIGIRPVLITSDMVGQTIGQFVSIEVKEEGWEYRSTEHEFAQARWNDMIIDLGGYAKFSTGEL